MYGYPEEQIDLSCNQQLFSEFPDLLFGTTDSGASFFDATLYLNKQHPDVSIKSFFLQCKWAFVQMSQSYDVDIKDAIKVNKSGHYLIDGIFLYLFLSFAEPNFLAYMCDRIHELFTQGVVVSDTYLLNAARSRLTLEALQKITQDGNGKR